MTLYTIDELSKIVKYSKNTLYKKKKEMKIGKHYYQLEKGKILFSDLAITFFLNTQKGKHKNESFKRNIVQEKKQPVSLSEYLG
ncbi:hypothetical protein KO488_08265 [Poseidonibacter lekithochrous]|uniref:hypothetical protein n=1 Tax=Poseidonibacter TaxID=2321187 RepID=UPI001C09F2F1|nr:MULTISPECIES: hypothetical protein [Poseidonibacter]MBU3014748.1 hypothetical protein [Poseidonibacter lekithochrous]MDO6828046.1 hypothetical protein [Poseidonibacter sp. 1_MG-2023]